MARVRIMKDGVIVLAETETFDRKQAAQAWIKKRETELSEPGAIEHAGRPDPTLKQVIDQYLSELLATRNVGDTKKNTLRQIARTDLAAMRVSQINSTHLVEYARNRILVDGVQPQTASQDILILSSVFNVANAAWGYQVDYDDIRKTKAVMNKLGIWSKSKNRERTATTEEIDRLMTYFMDRQRRRKAMMPMTKVIAFALFSTRRLDEICRIKWEHLDDTSVLVEDMKHPRIKWGNHVRCTVPPEAMAVIKSMPRTSDRIFPFTGDAIGANYQRACKWLGIENLTFHDLRHTGITRQFELDNDVPYVASVSGHRQWQQLARYTHFKGHGDKYANATWLEAVGIKKPPAEARGERGNTEQLYISDTRPAPSQAVTGTH